MIKSIVYLRFYKRLKKPSFKEKSLKQRLYIILHIYPKNGRNNEYYYIKLGHR